MDTDHRRLGAYYAGAAAAAILAFLHFSVAALLLALILWVRLARRDTAPRTSAIMESHRRWLRRTLMVPLGLYGGLLAVMVFEAVQLATYGGAAHLIQAVATHMVLHSAVTVLSGLWLVLRLLIGGLRFVYGRET